MRRLILPMVLIAAASPAAQARERAAPSRPPAEIWRSTCSYCHEGKAFAPALRGRALPPAAIVAIARQGANGMPPFHASEISDADLEALARWISASPVTKEHKK